VSEKTGLWPIGSFTKHDVVKLAMIGRFSRILHR
jgi:hypothetical protein